MIKNFVKIMELLGDRLEVCVSVSIIHCTGGFYKAEREQRITMYMKKEMNLNKEELKSHPKWDAVLKF